jgi:glycosyltransferase involved in cell wall biosynthesis
MSTNSGIYPLPMVSVIVPVYNAEKYVEECIKSILNQDYSNIELIIVNDGSTDNSYEICKMISEKDERIQLYDRNNCGVGRTRNFGIEKASGKYITFVDADDFLDKNMIRRMVDEAEENDAEVVVAGFRRVTEAGEIVHEESYEEKIIDDVKNEFAPRLIGSRPECRDSIFATVWGKLYLHKCFSESLVRFNDSRIYEDLMFLLDFMLGIDRVALFSYFI